MKVEVDKYNKKPIEIHIESYEDYIKIKDVYKGVYASTVSLTPRGNFIYHLWLMYFLGEL